MRATVRLVVTAPDGGLVAERRAHNTVLVSGARLVADLFAGSGGAITHMGVGSSGENAGAVDTAALSNDDGAGQPALAGETTAAIPADRFDVTVDDERKRVVVRVRGTLPEPAAVGTIREAALVSRGAGGDVLYNRVVFAPLPKGDDHELTLFWEVEFPYGDLQWLAR
jgi:hypothetical protein